MMDFSRTRISLSAVVILVVLTVGLAIPVSAQGQSPTTPQTRPGTSQTNQNQSSGLRGRTNRSSSLSGLGSSLDSGTDNPQGQTQSSTGSRLRKSRLSDSNSSEKAAPATAESPTADKAKPEPPAPRDSEKSGKSERGSGGARSVSRGSGTAGLGGAGGGGTSITGARPGAGAAPGQAEAGAGGSRVTKGSGGLVSQQGTQGVFEPVFDRNVSYGEVPDVGEPLTLPGPMSVKEFLDTIHQATNWNILVTEAAQELQLQFWIVEKKPSESLEVLKFHDIYYEYDEKTNFLRVMTKDEWLFKTYGTSKPTEFQVKFADPTYIESILSSLLSGVGRLITDQRTGRIYVWDMEDNLNQMASTVEELDVPLQKQEFTVRHAELADVESVLSGMISANGSIIADARTGQLMVWDSPAVLEQIKATVERLDVPVDSKTFAVQYVNAEDLVDSLESLISERGLIQVDPRSNALVVSDLPARLERIGEIVKTLDVQLETRTWVVKYAELDFVADQIESLIPDDMGEIVVNEDVHQITVTGLPARLDQIDELVKTWDIKRQQVLIEAFIVEIDSEVERQFGVNWSYFDSTGNAPIAIHSGSGFSEMATAPGAGESMSIGQLPYSVPAYGALQVDSNGKIVRPALTNINGKPIIDKLAGNNLGVTLKYLDSQNKATILSSPRVVVQDGEEAAFENATRVPYISSSNSYPNYNNNNNNNNNSSYYYPYSYYGGTNRVEFIDVGTILSVLPRITEENNILLDISAEDSSYKDKEIKSNDQTSTVPEKTVRHAETQLRIQSGETVVLGGLRRSRSSHSVSKTPLFGDLPLLGRLFRNPSKASRNDNLLIFITTTVVDEFTHPEAEILAKAESTIADENRFNKKDLWGRMHDRASKGQNEMPVSIGQSGTIYSRGKPISIENLRAEFAKREKTEGTLVVLRCHPRAPENMVNAVSAAAEDAGMKVELDDSAVPLVPSRIPPASPDKTKTDQTETDQAKEKKQ